VRNRFTIAAASPDKPTATRAIPSAALSAFDEVRLLRALQTIEEVLTKFYGELEIPWHKSMPITFIRKLFEDISPGDVTAALEARLHSLGAEYPVWSEVWLELAYLMEDLRKTAAAADCYARAIAGERLSDIGPRTRDPRAFAAAALGRLLLKQGRHDDASDAFDFAVTHDMEQRIVASDHGDLLRHQGRLQEALKAYTRAIFNEETRWSLPSLPRDANKIRFLNLRGPYDQATTLEGIPQWKLDLS
jgi:tetratricopeptide (TPR) repeat protein